MATPSRIGIEQEDGSVKSIYCHWDGHVETNGKRLVEHFSNPAKAAELIELGHIAVLYPKLYPSGPHTFDRPEDEVTIAYHRDRGQAKVINKDKTVARYFEQSYEEYIYMLTQEGEWICKAPKIAGILKVEDAMKFTK